MLAHRSPRTRRRTPRHGLVHGHGAALPVPAQAARRRTRHNRRLRPPPRRTAHQHSLRARPLPRAAPHRSLPAPPLHPHARLRTAVRRSPLRSRHRRAHRPLPRPRATHSRHQFLHRVRTRAQHRQTPGGQRRFGGLDEKS